jgi:hypothetical protein
MIASRRIQQQRLGNRVPTLVAAVEQQSPDRFRPRGATRLTRALNRDAGPLQRRGKQLQLGRFPGPLPALDRDKAAARRSAVRNLRRRRAGQCLLPQIQFPAPTATRPNTPMRSTLAAA